MSSDELVSRLRLQVLLDRAHFSVGEIDGADELNTRRALAAYRREKGLRDSGPPTERDWTALDADSEPILTAYTLTDADVAGPFREIPEDMVEKAALESLDYRNLLEKLGEDFHASPALLERLNPGKTFATAGEVIQVPNVTRKPIEAAASVVVDRSDASVAVVDGQGRTLARYPASMGSPRDPLPLGLWKINGVSRDPSFHYNPELFWDADPNHEKVKLAPGPNNPVGRVWIDLSKEHYGIHGTPEPAMVGKTQSHGCVRLANWDALELAELVAPGMPAVLRK